MAGKGGQVGGGGGHTKLWGPGGEIWRGGGCRWEIFGGQRHPGNVERRPQQWLSNVKGGGGGGGGKTKRSGSKTGAIALKKGGGTKVFSVGGQEREKGICKKKNKQGQISRNFRFQLFKKKGWGGL